MPAGLKLVLMVLGVLVGVFVVWRILSGILKLAILGLLIAGAAVFVIALFSDDKEDRQR